MSELLRDFLRLLGVGAVLMGMFFLGAGGLLIYSQMKSTKGWPTTTGEIVSGNVYEVQGKRFLHHRTMYGARWLIRYKVGDSIYDSTANAGFEMSDRKAMQKTLDEKPPGSKVQVLYSPDENGRIALSEGMLARSSPVVRLLELGTGCFLGGLLLMLVIPRIG